MWIKIRATAEDKHRWQALAASRNLSLSGLIRRGLSDGKELRKRVAPRVNPALLRELARIGNNLNQLARAANSSGPLPAAAIVARLIEIDRDLAALRASHEGSGHAD